MARPAKSVNVQASHLTKKQKIDRQASEKVLKGAADKINPPPHLNSTQQLIFRLLVSELEASGILCNLDIFILSQCSIAIDRLQTIETMINEKSEYLLSNNLMSSKDKYSKDLYRCCNELCLSPQSRAKVKNINTLQQQEQKDPLLIVLKGGKPDDKTASGI